MRKSGLSARDHDERQVRSAVRPGTRPSAVKATLGRNKLWVTTGAANHPALTKSKRPTPVFPVPADSLKACAYTHMGRGPQGVAAGFCWRGRNPTPNVANPPALSALATPKTTLWPSRRACTSIALRANGGRAYPSLRAQRSNPERLARGPGLLRCARNDGGQSWEFRPTPQKKKADPVAGAGPFRRSFRLSPETYLSIELTTPAPTVRPPSRIVKR